MEFEMGSLAPATHYTVGVHAVKEAQKSDSASTEFTTGGSGGETYSYTHAFISALDHFVATVGSF